MAETLFQEDLSVEFIPESPEVQAHAAEVASRVGGTAVEEILRTDPTSQFELPEGITSDVTYTVPTGDK